MTDFSTYDLVVGLGRSGVSMARFLKSLGQNVLATDIDGSRTREAAALEALGIPTRIGSHDQETFDRARVIIPSPGIPLTMPYLKAAAAKGVKITGELDIFSHYNTTPVIAVSGSNGKTTTTRLIGEMARASGLNCFVGGNIGTPLVEYLMSGERADLVAAEVSSFQLDLAKTFKPRVGVLLNISQDHLDRYPDYKAYRDSKWSLLVRQDRDDTAVVNKGIQNFDTRTAGLKGQVLGFSPQTGKDNSPIRVIEAGKEKFIPAESLTLPGGHNRENITAAALAVLAAGGTTKGIIRALDGFTPLPHRTAFVRSINGIDFFNDSKATNTDAVIRALEVFDAPVFLILGGREKDTDFAELIPAVTSGVKAIMAIGDAKDHIKTTFSGKCPVFCAGDMDRAVTRAYESADKGDIVLLSPACASFDMYDNYEERGNDFINLVNSLEAAND